MPVWVWSTSRPGYSKTLDSPSSVGVRWSQALTAHFGRWPRAGAEDEHDSLRPFEVRSHASLYLLHQAMESALAGCASLMMCLLISRSQQGLACLQEPSDLCQGGRFEGSVNTLLLKAICLTLECSYRCSFLISISRVVAWPKCLLFLNRIHHGKETWQ